MTPLSTLQRYILRTALAVQRVEIERTTFLEYYKRKRSPISIDSLTRAIERLIDRGFLIGYGRRTPKKWFIERVRLTDSGRKQAKALYGVQQRLFTKNI
jgi:hypothetical protein